MDFSAVFSRGIPLLMEGALGERLKHEYHLSPDPHVSLAIHCTTPKGKIALREIWSEYASIALQYGLPFLATTPTRRSNQIRVHAAGLDARLLRENVRFLRSVLNDLPGMSYLGGMIGCHGDAYTGEGSLAQETAYFFHRWQTELFKEEGVDFLYGALLPTLPEALGLAQAMQETDLPFILSFTIKGDGTLIDGTPISQAIRTIDMVAPPLCYMTNCVHPSIVYRALSVPCNQDPSVRTRFLGIQGNTSPLSYAELDKATDLLTSDPAAFARDTVRLLELADFRIFGGCCGTDGRHLRQIAKTISVYPSQPRKLV